MRRIQLSFTLDQFGEAAPDGRRQKVMAYIDGNDVHKITRDFLTVMLAAFPNEESMEALAKGSIDCLEEFGRCQGSIIDSEGNKEDFGGELSQRVNFDGNNKN